VFSNNLPNNGNLIGFPIALHLLKRLNWITGLRAEMGAGNSKMNDLTVIQTTQVSLRRSKRMQEIVLDSTDYL